MARVQEILAKESLCEPRIFLYKEGIFWRAYQYSAYRLIQIKPDLKLNKRYVKKVSCELVTLGFPDKTVERLFDPKEIEYVNEKMISIASSDIDMQAYASWFASVALTDKKVQAQSLITESVSSASVVLQKIKEFPIEQSTPMDCLNFLVLMRKELS